jgi:sulfur transfer protein SufE
MQSVIDMQQHELPNTIYLLVDDYTKKELDLTGNNLKQAGYETSVKRCQNHVWLMAYLPVGIL